MNAADNDARFAQEVDRTLRATGGAQAVGPLSAEQRRWWLLRQLSGDAPCTLVARHRIKGPVDVADVQLRLAQLGRRQEALRSVFTEVAGRPVRLTLPLAELALRTMNVGEAPDPEQVITDLCTRMAAEPPDVQHGPLLRVVLFRLATDRWELFSVAHRLIADPSSLDLLAAELSGARSGSAGDLAALVEAEEQRHQDGEDRARELGKLLSVPNAREIPTPRPRPEVKGQKRAVEFLELPPASTAGRLGALRCTDRAVAAWLAVLMRYQGSDSAQCGVHLPRPAASASVFGPLDDVRPVRVDLPVDAPLTELVRATADELKQARTDGVPFARLLEVCPPERDVSRTPYVQTALRVVDRRADDSAAAAVPCEIGCGQHDIDLTVWLLPQRVTLQVDYDATLYSADDVWGVAASLAAVLRPLLTDAEPAAVGVPELPLLEGPNAEVPCGRGERHELPGASLVDLVAKRATDAEHADLVAVRCHGADVSYGRLWHRSGVIAGGLQDRGVTPGDRVALWLSRGPDAIATQLAVVRCGAVFVPIDPHHPAERARYLLHDSGAVLVVSDSSTAPPDDLPVPVLLLESLGAARDEPAPVDVRPEDPAYMIYTSGSTGLPKGVVVRHRNAVNNLLWRQRTWELRPGDRVLHNHAFSFDPSVWAGFWPLIAGATIVLARENELDDPTALLRLIRDERLSVVGGVPSLLRLLLAHPEAGESTGVRLLLSGAEPLEPDLVRRARDTWSAEVANLYGPTETTIDATAYAVPAGARGTVPIGRAIHNVDAHVVDGELRPVPDMVPGEIVIGGAGVALGYQGRPGLTAARFLPDPYGEPGARIYRTGDLGRQRPSGEIEFLGRIDDQVKIRGHRVEPRETEAALLACPHVAAAAVVPIAAGTGQARLAAAIVRTEAGGDAAVVQELRAELLKQLPRYLVPDTITVVDDLPRTATGKLDLAALRENFSAPPRPAAAGGAPRTPLERAVAEDFQRVLGVEELAVDADFFEAGGTSVMLARLATLLQARHQTDIPLHEFFRVPTAAGVAETIDTYRRGGLAAVLGKQHAFTLERDGSLDEAIRPDGLPHADWAVPRRVLLTGATGYLGLHLLEELLNRTDAEIVCLCRAEDEEHALQRLREGFVQYEIDAADRWHRVQCVVGDLGKDRFGLDEEQWAELAATVDVIYHNGALVNFVYPYSALKEPNVAGTQRVLDLACTTRLKAVHHISTIDTLLATHTPRPFLEDASPLRSAVHVPAGYTGSKWVAEKVVDVARRRGIPVTVFRPGLILGHTRTGATQATDYLLMAFRGYLPMRVLPDYPRIFDTVPVDYVASAVVHISRRPEALGGFYHLFNPAPVALDTFCGWLADYGYRFDIVPFEEGRRRALAVGPGHPLYSILPLIRDAEPEPHRALDPAYLSELTPAEECAATLRLLEGSGISCPPSSREQAFAVMDYLVRTKFLPRPEDVVPDTATGPGGA
ncbi:non-ribosomal peptide synthetase [Streptomyces yerevanensis]|uniref:non-ribosomal peptide synthetase n=1 Tax=Streptomyces yerevanensis TaxID=66378 RepID=UPI00068F769A|nr:non-ribosomal peptide synthetase [Streptomyces yerevanensis]